MLQRHTLGKLPAKPHTTLYENDKLLMEQMITREGFNGPFSILYYRHPPTDEIEVSDLSLPGFCPFDLADDRTLKRRHVRSQDHAATGDSLSGRRTLLVSDDLELGICKPAEESKRFFANGDGDELYFVNNGAGTLECLYGRLPFGRHDYVLIPRGTPYRFTIDEPTSFLVIEGHPEVKIPTEYRNVWGQLSDFAPYSHRDFRLPQELLWPDGPPGDEPHELVVKRGGSLTLRRYRESPLDVAGWDGCIYPVAFNIHDYQPKTGLVHLPPTIHTTFAGGRFVVCSFVPRLVDYHEQAVPCPYGHANVEMDEILYYVEGNFTSRKGIEAESITLHPAGVAHGPHPGMYERSIGAKRTSELAVMIDGYAPYRLTTAAQRIEDDDYHMSWVR